jgi:hypothetical protein
VAHYTRGYEETSFFWNDVVRDKSTQINSKNTILVVFFRQHECTGNYYAEKEM